MQHCSNNHTQLCKHVHMRCNNGSSQGYCACYLVTQPSTRRAISSLPTTQQSVSVAACRGSLHNSTTGTPSIDVGNHCKWDRTSDCASWKKYQPAVNTNNHQVGTASNQQDLYAVLHRMSDSDKYKEYDFSILHAGASCIKGNACANDWRGRDASSVCNRNAY